MPTLQTLLLKPIMSTLKSLQAVSDTLAEAHPGLNLLVLFGSRARGEDDPSSDWDFAFLSDSDLANCSPFWFPGSDLLHTLSHLLHISDEKLDIVNLSNCSEILAHFIARDGQVVYEKTPGAFTQFQHHALKSEAELKAFRHTQRKLVRYALQRWGV
jgi:uncharacterized protein